jgi:hypothetical protein
MMKKTMNDFLHKGIRELKRLALSPQEKEAVFARLVAHMEKRPARLVSPWQISVSRFRFQYAIASLLIMVLAGGTVTFAAEGALPGDLLYPVKLNVTEPLQGAMVTGEIPKAKWQAQVAVRRLEEAETLAAQGRLNEATLRTVHDNFREGVQAFNASVRSAEEKEPSADLVNATVDFEADINAHARILSVVGDAATSTLAIDISALRSAVDESAQSARVQREKTAGVFLTAAERTDEGSGGGATMTLRAIQGESQAEKMFKERAQAVQAIISETEDQLRQAASLTGATTSPSSVQQDIVGSSVQSLVTAQKALSDAQEMQDRGDSSRAFSALLDSESAAKTADTSFHQGLRFGKEERASGHTDSSD